jgi:hypothetical protein
MLVFMVWCINTRTAFAFHVFYIMLKERRIFVFYLPNKTLVNFLFTNIKRGKECLVNFPFISFISIMKKGVDFFTFHLSTENLVCLSCIGITERTSYERLKIICM